MCKTWERNTGEKKEGDSSMEEIKDRKKEVEGLKL
jgi:hypothetical protein